MHIKGLKTAKKNRVIYTLRKRMTREIRLFVHLVEYTSPVETYSLTVR